jgi:hypothetical protein
VGTIPTPPTFTAGQILTAAQLSQIVAVQNFWASPPQCQGYNSGGTSLGNGATVTVPLASEYYDVVQSGDTPMHDNVTNNTRITCRTAGKYQVDGYLSFQSNATGLRRLDIIVNGVTQVQATSPAVSGASTNIQASVTVPLSVGDYVELAAFQTSGGTLALNGTAPGPSRLTVRLISS